MEQPYPFHPFNDYPLAERGFRVVWQDRGEWPLALRCVNDAGDSIAIFYDGGGAWRWVVLLAHGPVADFRENRHDNLPARLDLFQSAPSV